jgi:hypothetical protein
MNIALWLIVINLTSIVLVLARIAVALEALAK